MKGCGMTIIQLLKDRTDEILSRAYQAMARAHLKSYWRKTFGCTF
jgi:hypothetical protein